MRAAERDAYGNERTSVCIHLKAISYIYIYIEREGRFYKANLRESFHHVGIYNWIFVFDVVRAIVRDDVYTR